MKIMELGLKNFMPFKGENCISFPQDEGRNVLIILGKNMRGKTSILNGLRWAFYGKALGRHLKELNTFDMLNKEALSEEIYEFEVRVVFYADGSTYVLTRKAYKRPHVIRPVRSEDMLVTVILQKDSNFITADQIDFELSRFFPEQISRFFLFDGELLQEYESLSIEGSDQGKKIKQAIEQILGVPTLLNADADIAVILKDAQKKMNTEQAHSKDLEEKSKRLAELQAEQEQYEKDISILLEQMEKIHLEIEKLEDELDKVDKVYQAKARLDAIEEKKKNELDKISTIQNEQLILLKDAWRDLVRGQIEIIKKDLESNEHTAISKIEANTRLRYRIEQLTEIIINDKCLLCGQSINTNSREVAKKDLGKLQAQIHDTTSEQERLEEIRISLKEISNIITKSTKTAIIKNESEIVTLYRDIVKLENEAEKERQEIEGYDTSEIAKKRALKDGFLREEGNLENKINDQKKLLDDVTRKIALLSKQMSTNDSVKKNKTAKLVSICTDIQAAIRNSIDSLRDQLKVIVAAKANQAFHEMTTQPQYKELSINDNYGLTIIDYQDKVVTIRSAGAEQIVALSLIDGLTRTGRSAGPIIMDTPFGRLDLQHRSNILRYLPTTTSQLVLLVHDGEIRIDTDLAVISDRIFKRYEIVGINSNVSRLEVLK